MKNKMYYSLIQNDNSAVLNIFGDITSYPYEEFGEMSCNLLSKKLEQIGNVDVIDVYINSYGGEVAEGLSIYNALKRHKAKVRTHVDGFACSIASVIFMAGDERIMPKTSCLMIHNPWVSASGDANALRKQAEDLEIIGECSINAYMEHVNITEEDLKKMLDNETWLSPSDAVEMGFATSLEEVEDGDNACQSVKTKIIEKLLTSNIKDDRIQNSICESNSKEADKQLENNTENGDIVNENQIKNLENDEENDSSKKAIEYIAVFLENIERKMLK